MHNIKLGDNSLDVCKTILLHHSEIQLVDIVSHNVQLNWRQLHVSNKAKLDNLTSSFYQSAPLHRKTYRRDQFMRLKYKELSTPRENFVWSICSKVLCAKNAYRHIPMMNFHPETGDKHDILTAILEVCGNRPGVLLQSGRYYHYYGDFLLSENEWQKFMALFLMPCFLVSPRYIGHRLFAGYSTLRLTTEKKFKPQIPRVVLNIAKSQITPYGAM